MFRKNPHIYEINLLAWLKSLSQRAGKGLSLKDIPLSVWYDIKDKGMDLVWLMGMWHRSEDGCQRAKNEPWLLDACRLVLDDFQLDDVAGSPYAIDRYRPESVIGDEQDLVMLKARLADVGLGLVLDFVPNHTARDHPWIKAHPDYYIHLSVHGEAGCPKGFFPVRHKHGESFIAHGKDPYFDPWQDTAQLDYSNPDTVREMAETFTDLFRYGHGLRCDMAMLMLKSVFNDTWKPHLKRPAETEFWSVALEMLASRKANGFTMAEVYWGLEQELLGLGFDFVYDKPFYDMLVTRDIHGLRDHLSAPAAMQEKMVRFLENHDEPRAMKVFGPERLPVVMVTLATLPGMRLWHHGQFEGNRQKVPIQLGRASKEPIVPALVSFSDNLLKEVHHSVFHEGAWEMCDIFRCSTNATYRNLLAWCWRIHDHRRLIVVNLSSDRAVGMLKMPPDWLPTGEPLLFSDPIKGDRYIRSNMQVSTTGLYVELPGRDYHFFKVLKG